MLVCPCIHTERTGKFLNGCEQGFAIIFGRTSLAGFAVGLQRLLLSVGALLSGAIPNARLTRRPRGGIAMSDQVIEEL